MIRNTFRLSLLSLFSLTLLQLPSFAYQVDSANKILRMSPSSTPTATTTDLRNALNALANRSDKTTPWTMKFAPGNYYLTGQVSVSNLQNVILESEPSKPAKLIKNSGWDAARVGEYMLHFRMPHRVQLIGFEIYGQTNFANGPTPYWPDQGVYFGSGNIVKVDQNKFFNFGNAALRVVTDNRDPVRGVNSFKTMVSNNTFNNIFQTATTATDQIHGGTAQSTWYRNQFINLRGSVKFATRTTGGRSIEFFENVINGSDHYGLEVNNYEDFHIRGNTFQNIKEFAMNIYTAGGDRVAGSFAWGDNFTIEKNTINNVGRAIRFAHTSWPDRYRNTPKNLVIQDNTISRVNERNTSVAAIAISGGVFNGLKVANNKFSTISSNRYITIPSGSTSVSTLNNLANGSLIKL